MLDFDSCSFLYIVLTALLLHDVFCYMGFQNLIYCPDCDREVSIYAETCPHCGRPIKKYLEENNINDFTRGFICPRCGVHEINYAGHCRRVNCKYCRVPFIQTKYEMVDLLNHHGCDKESIISCE